MLRFIQRQETDPYYNLAAEEYVLKTAREDTFMTWCNEPSVIIGKHQNAFKEINHSFVNEHNLPVIRRITGGGTVYHDPGNFNFSFIFTNRKENLIDFREFTRPAILFLQNLGLDASFEGKNNIIANGFKVSGNSAHLSKNKVLYHGTLLFNTDLENLDMAIAGRDELFTDKAVSSVRAKVANIIDLLAEKIPIDEFIILFREFIFNYFGDVRSEKLSDLDNIAIKKLADEKYRSFQWNFGYSPDYEFHNKWNLNGGDYFIHFKVKAGIIEEARIEGPESVSLLLKNIAANVLGILHERNSIMENLKHLDLSDKNEAIIVNQIRDHLF